MLLLSQTITNLIFLYATLFFKLNIQFMKNIFNDAKLLDLIMKGFDLLNDSQISKFLGITKTTIHSIRHGKAKFGIMQRLKLLDKIGFLKARSIIESILPEALSKAVRNSSNRIAHKRIKKSESSDAELIEILKDVHSFSTDSELAEFLGLARNTISMIRKGRTSLGPIPKLKILNSVDSFDLVKLENIINSTDLLSEEIEKWIEDNKK